MTKKIYFIKKNQDLEDAFKIQSQEQGLRFEIVDHFSKIESTDSFVVFAHGGDGSLNHTVNWLIKEQLADKVELLYHPSGTGNDFARAVGLVPNNIEQTISLLNKGESHQIVVGEFNQNYFINMISAGAFAQVTPEVDPQVKNTLGAWSYYLKGLESLGQINEVSSFSAEVIEGGEVATEDNLVGFFVGNSRFAGGGLKTTAEQSPFQENLDLFLIRKMTLPSLVALAIEAQKNHPDFSKFDVVYKKIRQVALKFDRPIPASVDGELRESSRMEVKVSDKKIRMLLP